MKSLSKLETPEVIWESKDSIRFQGERRRAEVTAHLLRPRSDDTVLDVGCGEGFQISYITQSSQQIVGIDISLERLLKAKERLKSPEFVCASSDRLPFRPRVFDSIMCLELLEHLQKPSKTLTEIAFVLKDTGKLVISVPYKERIIATRCVNCGKLTPLWGHIHSFDEKKLVSFLPDNLKVMQFVYTGTIVGAYPIFGSLPLCLWKLVDNFSRVLPSVKPSWFIVEVRKL